MLQDISTDKKVTVLGKTFNSEEERREYFRNELRIKLPELKQIEGFPIGEDEDIIKLSDPPYYTACPNPWLNDFIAEWEDEKKLLVEDGLRSTNFDVDEPYAADVSEGKNNAIYMAHSYHTKVPHPAIMRYILHYTQPGDIVYDGFAGTGMTGVAASLLKDSSSLDTNTIFSENSNNNFGKRQCINNDLSPAATFIAANFNMQTDINAFLIEAESILKKTFAEFSWLFEVEHESGKKGNLNYFVWSDVFECPSCHSEIVLFDAAVDIDGKKIRNEFLCEKCGNKTSKKKCERIWETQFDSISNQTIRVAKTIPVLVNYSLGNKRFERKISEKDLELLSKINSYELKSFVPIEKLYEGYNTNQPIKSNGVEYVHQFYSRRNLIFISIIWEKLKTNPLRMWLTASMIRTTRMYKFTLDRKMGTVSGTLYLPSFWTENSAHKLLKRKLTDIAKGLKLVKGNNVTQTGSASSTLLSDKSIDYIFTDPPFGANIMYSELNLLWESWLKVRTNNKEEAIENKFQGKSTFEYQSLMLLCFKEYFRVLKPGKWMTVEFSNTSAAVWNGIQVAIQNAGFIIANVSALDKKQGSFKAVSTVTAVKQDLVISCYKPSSEFDNKFKKNGIEEIGVWDFVEEHLNHLPIHLLKEESTTAIIERSPKILYDRLISFYFQRGLIPIDASKFQEGLRERYIERDGMFFTNEQVQVYDLKKDEHPNLIQYSLFVSSEQDGVLWLKNYLKNEPATYQDIRPAWMQAIGGVRKGDIIPEMETILEENFLMDDDNKWYLPDPENEADLEKLRNKRLIKQFEDYKSQATATRAKKIKEVRVDALRAGFKQCYQDKDFPTIVAVGDKIPNNLLMEDEVLLQFYDIARTRV